MMLEGAELVLNSVRLIETGDYTLLPQDDTASTSAPKIHRDTCEIKWAQPVGVVHNFVRGLSPWPAAWTMLNNAQLKIIRTTAETGDHDLPPGTVLTDDKTFMKVACSTGYLHVLELQLAGRKRMGVGDFLRGGALPPGAVLG